MRRVGTSLGSASRSLRLGRWRVILDHEPRRGGAAGPLAYETGLGKEEIARKYILERAGSDMTFLDVGARDGRLDYLLGVDRDIAFDQARYDSNRRRFEAKYRYYGLDLDPQDAPNVLTMDLCEPASDVTRRYHEFFDVAYSNNVFEHLRRPWIAAAHVLDMVKPGGLIVTVAPFSIRYHAVPDDYFRYTHRGVTALFSDQGAVEELVSGYDTAGRRVDWQGMGRNDDVCPEDAFGAWRENWFTINVLRKAGPS